MFIALFREKLSIKKFIFETLQLEKTIPIFSLNMKFNPSKLFVHEGYVFYEDVKNNKFFFLYIFIQVDKTKIFNVEKEELFTIENSVNFSVVEKSLLRYQENDNLISMREFSSAAGRFVEKFDVQKDKAMKYDVKVFDLPFLGLKKSIVISSLHKKELKVIKKKKKLFFPFTQLKLG